MKRGKLKELCLVIAGQSPKGSAYNDRGDGMEFHQGKKAFGDFYLTHSNIWTTEISKIAEPLDILMSVRAPVGPTNITDRQICIGRGLAAIRCKDNVSHKFILYALRNIESKIVGNDGAVFNSINKAQIEALPVPIIPLPEQECIVSLLDAQFAKIDAIKANAEKQLQDAKALFQSALKDYLTPKEGWEEKTLGEIAADSADGPFGSNLKAVHYTTKPQVRIVQLSNIGEYGWKDENLKYTTFEHLKAISRSEVTPGDIVIAKMMPAGRAIICPNYEKKYVLSSDAVKIKLINGYNTKYILHYINSIFFNKQVLENVSGSGRIRTSLTKLRSYKLYIPDFTTQTNIANKVDYLLKIYLQLQSNFDTTVTLCNDLKQSILKDIFG